MICTRQERSRHFTTRWVNFSRRECDTHILERTRNPKSFEKWWYGDWVISLVLNINSCIVQMISRRYFQNIWWYIFIYCSFFSSVSGLRRSSCKVGTVKLQSRDGQVSKCTYIYIYIFPLYRVLDWLRLHSSKTNKKKRKRDENEDEDECWGAKYHMKKDLQRFIKIRFIKMSFLNYHDCPWRALQRILFVDVSPPASLLGCSLCLDMLPLSDACSQASTGLPGIGGPRRRWSPRKDADRQTDRYVYKFT